MTFSNRILITGGSGFIGMHLLNKLLIDSYQIACIDLFYNQAYIKKYGNRVQLFTGDLLDKNFLNSCMVDFAPNYVYHLAGSKSRTNTISEFKTSNEINYLGTLNLFESLLACPDLKLVTILGTIEEYGNTDSPFIENSRELPNSAYGLSKLSATKLAMIFNQQFKFPVVVMRPSIVFGPNQGIDMFIPALIKALLTNHNFKMTEGYQLRDFIYIEDLTDALIKVLICNGLEGEIINIASGFSIKIKDIALQIAGLIKNTDNLKFGELPYRDSEIMEYAVDIFKASKLLQWHPKIKLSDGLKKTIEFYQKDLKDET